MANCKGECNKQMQGLSARLAHAEDNITNHYMGLSALIENLSSTSVSDAVTNPNASLGTPLLAIYNSLPSGMDLLQKLKDMLPSADAISMKKLMLKASEAMLDTLADFMDSAGAALIAEAEAAVALAENVVVSAEETLASAVSSGNQLAIDAAEATVKLANLSLDSSKLSSLSVASFMAGQVNISKCKSKSFIMSD